MSLIKIFANDIELDLVKETLSITKENNSLSKDFKVSSSSFPFLIVENSKTIQALGGRDVTTSYKPKIVLVVVEELNERYYGELQILSYLNGFRKVNLKYATELLAIMDKNISRFMPVVSVIFLENNPVPFVEESPVLVPGYLSWKDHVAGIINESYPDVKYNFPTMYWKNKFGADLTADDEWFNYQQHINHFDEDGDYVQNDFNSVGGVINAHNNSVPAPQVYLLSPLFYALDSLGWTMDGDFPNNELVKRILFLSTKNNLCKVVLTSIPSLLVLGSSWATVLLRFNTVYYASHKTTVQHTFALAGKYMLTWSFKITDTTVDNWGYKKTFVEITGYVGKITLFVNTTNGVDKVFSGTQEFNPTAGQSITIAYYNLHQNLPVEYTLSLVKVEDTKVLYEFHPTIELGRYVPEWSFGTYLNELKKFFNLKVDIDDFRKKISLNFNDDLIVSAPKEIISKSLAIANHEQPRYNAFHLKYQNNEDASLWITRAGVEKFETQTSEFSERIESKFKFVPNNGYTATLSEELESKDGVGIMIYDSIFAPNISDDYDGQTLSLDGEKGIYKFFHKNFLKFRLNASPVEITGYFTEIELSKIQKMQRIYLDHQDYIVSVLEYSETDQGNFEVLLKVESVNF